MNTFAPASVGSLDLFSHGVPGTVMLRYNWPGHADYGLTRGDARTLAPAAFALGAALSFDSCNTATDPSLFPGIADDDVSLAQVVANRSWLPVQAWVGRTSYRLVNRDKGGVVGSEVWPDEGGFDKVELYSSVLRQRTPVKGTTSRSTPPTVAVTIATHSAHEAMQGGTMTVLLHRRTAERYRSDATESEQHAVIGSSSALTWTGLAAGTYYLGLFHLSGLSAEGSITVDSR